MLFGSNNYGSNPGFLLTFLLAGLGMAALFQTWKNLLGLEVSAQAGDPVFLGSHGEFSVILSNVSRESRPGIHVHAASDPAGEGRGDIPPGNNASIRFTVKPRFRGWLTVERVVLKTRFPLGLFRAWCYVDTDAAVLVYPKLAERADGLRHAGETQLENTLRQSGDEDFSGHRPYQRGDTAMHIDWKALARGKGWHVKQFDAPGGEELWLDWDALSVRDTESRLSAMARGVLELDHTGRNWGFSIPGTHVAANIGLGHRNHCLRALALFDSGRIEHAEDN
jgi:uncharacterized protein (DUF58 family)